VDATPSLDWGQQSIEMAKTVRMLLKKDNKVHGLRAAYSSKWRDFIGVAAPISSPENSGTK
jgi:hypothetical protein